MQDRACSPVFDANYVTSFVLRHAHATRSTPTGIGSDRSAGPRPAATNAALAERLGVDRMALSRLVASGPQVVRMGRTRATAYALRPTGRQRMAAVPAARRCDAGELGRVIALVGGGFHVDAGPDCPNLRRPPEGDVAAFFPDLPWYLDDLRPQGFLGRSFAHGRGQALGRRRTSRAGNRTMC